MTHPVSKSKYVSASLKIVETSSNSRTGPNSILGPAGNSEPNRDAGLLNHHGLLTEDEGNPTRLPSRMSSFGTTNVPTQLPLEKLNQLVCIAPPCPCRRYVTTCRFPLEILMAREHRGVRTSFTGRPYQKFPRRCRYRASHKCLQLIVLHSQTIVCSDFTKRFWNRSNKSQDGPGIANCRSVKAIERSVVSRFVRSNSRCFRNGELANKHKFADLVCPLMSPLAANARHKPIPGCVAASKGQVQHLSYGPQPG